MPPHIQHSVNSFAAYSNLLSLAISSMAHTGIFSPASSTSLALTPNQSMWVRVYEMDNQPVTSSASVEYAVMPPPVISSVKPTHNGIYLSWHSGKSSGAPNVTRYAIYYDTAGTA